jgi:hypothetical protein
MPRIPAAERPRLTLEDYIVFFTTRGGTGLSLHQLNEVPTLSLVADQPVSVVPCACSELFFFLPPFSSSQIIYMHAFARLHHLRKVHTPRPSSTLIASN